jgi:hypothetical protein
MSNYPAGVTAATFDDPRDQGQERPDCTTCGVPLTEVTPRYETQLICTNDECEDNQ